jgi:hypothetical protein
MNNQTKDRRRCEFRNYREVVHGTEQDRAEQRRKNEIGPNSQTEVALKQAAQELVVQVLEKRELLPSKDQDFPD